MLLEWCAIVSIARVSVATVSERAMLEWCGKWPAESGAACGRWLAGSEWPATSYYRLLVIYYY